MCSKQFWVDPFSDLPREMNADDSGRAIYFKDLSNHLLEILTIRYGGERLTANASLDGTRRRCALASCPKFLGGIRVRAS
jgi:hypothetical protein